MDRVNSHTFVQHGARLLVRDRIESRGRGDRRRRLMSSFAALCLNAFFVWLVFPFLECRRELAVALRHYFGECRCGMRFYRCPELTSAPRPRD
jgi:hypothetical protein